MLQGKAFDSQQRAFKQVLSRESTHRIAGETTEGGLRTEPRHQNEHGQ